MAEASSLVKPTSVKKSILNLNTDCCEEILEYLSLEDLNSFGQTCTSTYKITGEYIHRNFYSLKKYIYDDGIYVNSSKSVVYNFDISAFNEFIKFISCRYNRFYQDEYIKNHGHEFKLLNEISFEAFQFDELSTESFQAILSKIEVLEVEGCSIENDFYESLLKFCKNLKEISIKNDSNYNGILQEDDRRWLNQEYPLLEVVRLHPKVALVVFELRSFLEKNSKIHTFSTTSNFLYENKADLLQSHVKLDKIEISDGFIQDPMKIQRLSCLLNELYKQGFYKRLHLEIDTMKEEEMIYFESLDALESLSVSDFNRNCILSRLNNLKKLSLSYNYNANDMILLAIGLPNLREVSLNTATLDYLLPFVNHTTKLKKIDILKFKGALDFVSLNNEREKLNNAQKIIIYVNENTFLDTKWSVNHGDLNLRLIEIRRSTAQR